MFMCPINRHPFQNGPQKVMCARLNFHSLLFFVVVEDVVVVVVVIIVIIVVIVVIVVVIVIVVVVAAVVFVISVVDGTNWSREYLFSRR